MKPGGQQGRALVQEWRGSHLVRSWGSTANAASDGGDHSRPLRTGMRGLLEVLSRTFMPEGWPEAVSSDYLAFQAWDTVQAVSSYVRGMLSSQAIMHGIGVGREAATAYSAVYMFAVRDLTGMIGGLVFAHIEGSGFDSCAKQWRLYADVTNDLAMAVDLASPLFPGAFLLMACVASLARAMTGVAGGATRAALTQHFAKKGNAADIAAKEQSQETAVTAIGMVLGMLLTRMCDNSHLAAWLWFSLLTIGHIWANIRAMRCLVLTSINQPRLGALLQGYVAKGHIAQPEQMSAEEDLMPPPFRRLLSRLQHATSARPPPIGICLGVSLGKAAKAMLGGSADSKGQRQGSASHGQQEDAAVGRLLKEQGHRKYLLVPSGTAVLVVLHKSAGGEDLLRAYTHAWQVAKAMSSGVGKRSLLEAADAWMQGHYEALQHNLLLCGWQTGHVMLPKEGYTADWEVRPSKKE